MHFKNITKKSTIFRAYFIADNRTTKTQNNFKIYLLSSENIFIYDLKTLVTSRLMKAFLFFQ